MLAGRISAIHTSFMDVRNDNMSSGIDDILLCMEKKLPD